MNIRQKLSAEDMRERILVVAEEHFRRIGYAKTAVADIAAAMHMSPANVYRFFPSKLAINDAICGKLMAEIDRLMESICKRDEPAPSRLRMLFVELHRFNKTRLTDEHRLFDMVEVAMAESWPAIEAHCTSVAECIGHIIASGVARGEFRSVDVPSYAETVFNASAKIFHPTLIAQCADEDQIKQANDLADLVIASLRL
jgi:AcrR family transcriptional regulator